MKKTLYIIFSCIILFFACKSNKSNNSETNIEQNIAEIKASTAEQGRAGKGKITLQCNGKTYKINGVCGGVTSMGTLTIAVPDDSIPAKTFIINFTIDKMPSATTSYTIVKYNYDDKDANHVSISYTDMRPAFPMNWESDDKTGNLDFVVNGDEIKCSFSNLELEPSIAFNKGETNAIATISGELIIFKN